MRNRLFLTLAICLVLGVGIVLGAGFVTFGSWTQTVQAASSLPAENRDAGILVGAVLADSPAAKAGLVRGDIIVAVNGTALDAKNAPADLLKDKKAGDTLTLKVLHGDEVRSVDVTLADQNGKPYLGIVQAFTGRMGQWPGAGNPPANPGNNTTPRFQGGGAHVVEVTAGGPAEKAGIKVGDIILKVNDQVIGPNNDLARIFAALMPGDGVKLSVQGKGAGAALDLQVTLGENPDKAGQAYLGIKYQMLPVAGVFPKSLVPNQPNQPNQPSLPNWPQAPQGPAGLVVMDVKTGSPAEKVGVKVKDVITEANGKAVTSPEDFVALVQAAKVGDKLTLSILRAGEANAVKIEVVLGASADKADQAYLGVSVSGMMRGLPRGLPNGAPGGRSRGTPPLQGSNS